eukprot:2195478-Pleurochrysis_carterae.AAC.2
MYSQTTRARGFVLRLTAAVHARRNTPLEQSSTPDEGQDETIALRRWRRENCFNIGKTALCGR